MLAAEDLPTLALDKADAFDYHFMAHLMRKLQASTDQTVRVWIMGRRDSRGNVIYYLCVGILDPSVGLIWSTRAVPPSLNPP